VLPNIPILFDFLLQSNSTIYAAILLNVFKQQKWHNITFLRAQLLTSSFLYFFVILLVHAGSKASSFVNDSSLFLL